ncbi:MAG: hypothetical protein ABI208_07410 [Ginsengibacter sp.]|jgi:hypothetical protein
MKTKIALFFALIVMTTASAFAQNSPQMRRTVEERVKSVMEKLSTPLMLTPVQVQKTDSVFTSFYKAQDKMGENMMASGERPDRSVFEKLTSNRDEALKTFFTKDQYTKYINEILPTLQPQRRRN